MNLVCTKDGLFCLLCINLGKHTTYILLTETITFMTTIVGSEPETIVLEWLYQYLVKQKLAHSPSPCWNTSLLCWSLSIR